VAQVVDIVDEISRSVTSNRNALLNVIRLKNKDEYTYLHSVAVCTLMVNAAHQLASMPTPRAISALPVCCTTSGKCVPEPVLNKEGGLTDEEFALVKDHPGRAISF
jgi:HD-GYP domain-containing protein (c-di-GMP phosphodiesterase class II)